jgi:uncharacterized tellurite resistance protein B-like protein
MITEEQKKFFLQLYAIALADKNVSAEELLFLHEFAKQNGMPEDSIESLLLMPVFQDVQPPESLNEKVEYLYFSTGMALADGQLADSEREALRTIVLQLGFLEENADAIVAFFTEELRKGTSISDIQAIVKLNLLT